MNASERDKIGEMLSAYLDGELTGEQAGAVEQLIAEDAEARALLIELREAVDGVRQLPRAVAPSSILNEIQERVERQELLGPPDQPVTLSRHQRRPLRSILATAAALVITVGGGLWAINWLGKDRGERQVATMRENDEQALRRQLESFPQQVRNEKSSPAASLGDANEREDSLGIGRLEADRDMGSVKPQSVVQSRPARMSTRGAPAGKGREARTMDDHEIKLALKQLSNSKDGASAIGEAFGRVSRDEFDKETSANPQEEKSPAKADVEVRGRRSSGFDSRTATLEQKLANDLTVGALLDHPFANEPLRLEIRVAGAERVPAVAERVRSLIRSSDDVRFGFDGGSKFETAPLDVQPGRVDDKSLSFGAYRSLVMEGEPLHNFEPSARAERQYLARVDAATLTRILNATREGDLAGGAIVGRRFAVGRMGAESDRDVEQLAAMTLGDEFFNRAAGVGRAVATGQTDDEKGAAVDLAELLRGIGIGPPKVNEFGVESDKSVESERRFADAARATARRGGRVSRSAENEAVEGADVVTPPDAPRMDEGVEGFAKRGNDSAEPSRQPPGRSDVSKSEIDLSEVDESESIDALAKQPVASEPDARQRAMASEPPAGAVSPSPLYTIVIRFISVPTANTSESDVDEAIESGQSQPDRAQVETASPAPSVSPVPTVSPAPVASPGATKLAPTKSDSSAQAPIEMSESPPTASPEPAKNE